LFDFRLTRSFHLLTAIIRDLTEEVEAAKLKQAEDDCLPQLIWKIKVNGDALSLNKRFLNYTGFKEDQIESINVFDPAVMHPDDASIAKMKFAQANQTEKKSFEVKRRLLGKDGEYKWMLTRASPMFDDAGEITVWCGSCTDIDASERIQAELDILPEALTQMLWKTDLKGDVLYSNTKFQEYIGIRKDF
jgi:PAS domain S-box-containing protein